MYVWAFIYDAQRWNMKNVWIEIEIFSLSFFYAGLVLMEMKQKMSVGRRMREHCGR